MILTLNAGSSSLKFALFRRGDAGSLAAVAEGLYENLGRPSAALTASFGAGPSRRAFTGGHEAALASLTEELRGRDLLSPVSAVAHRVVHGGARFKEAVVVDAEVEAALEELAVLAPLHNPVNLQGIRLARRALDEAVVHVAVFDTAFHATLPPQAYRYAVPQRWYEEYGVRKYGFHGTSHGYVAREAARLLAGGGRRHARLVTLHLGNGCSAAAVLEGRCVDTTMGLTPLAGLVMGTRSGDVDPGLAAYLTGRGVGIAEQNEALNKRSGLLGLAGDNDMRTLLARRDEGDAGARLAVGVFVYRLRKTVGALAAALGGLDGLVFTAGIGENAAAIRAEVCEGLEFLGIEVDAEVNAGRSGGVRLIGRGTCAVLVVPTDEERALAEAAGALLGGQRFADAT